MREAVLAHYFGANYITDGFVLAYQIPYLILSFFVGATATTYISINAGLRQEEKNRFFSNIITIFLLLSTALTLLLVLLPRPFISLLSSSDIKPETRVVANQLLRYMGLATIPLLLASILSAQLQVSGKFFIATAYQIFNNIFIIIGIVFAHTFSFLPWMGIGMTIGNTLSLFVLILFNRDPSLQYRPLIDCHDPHLRQFFILLTPMILSTLVGEVNAIVDRRMASSLDEGTVSVLNYASKVNGVFSAIIGMSVGTAFFPRMSEFAQSNDIDGMKDQTALGIRIILPILLPLTIGIIILAQPLIRILLERREFNREATIRTAQCLQMFVIGLFAVNLNQIITRAFYARKKTRLPAILSAVSVALNIICILVLIGPLGARGPALATSISGTALLLGLRLFLRKDIGDLHIYDKPEWLKLFLATGIMSISIFAISRFVPFMTTSYFVCALMLGGTVLGAILLYAGVLIVTKSEVASLVIGMVQSVISKKRTKT